MLTEAEARATWCPMARADNANDRPVAVNRQAGGKPDHECLCLASGCMMWRKGSKALAEFYVTRGDLPETSWNWDPTGHKGYEDCKVRKVTGDEKGYCGLGGRPTPT